MNPYKVLQVDREAEHDVIDAAYKRLATKYHPDKDPSPSATTRMQEINAAFEILKDPERRRQFDRSRKEARAERVSRQETPEPAPHAASDRPEIQVEAISNHVFRKVLWAAGIVALLVYLPWLAAIVAGGWAAIWFFRKFPTALAGLLKVGVAIAVAGGIYWWRQEAKRKDELASLNVGETLDRQVETFTRACSARASRDNPELAQAYCACMSARLKANLDYSEIKASSVYDFDQRISARLERAAPTLDAQTICREQVQPKPPVLAAAPAKPKRQRRPVPAPNDGVDPAVREAMRVQLGGTGTLPEADPSAPSTAPAPRGPTDLDPAARDAQLDHWQ